MSSIKVRNESRPTRCEICHQVDQFDADRNFCARCNVLPMGEAVKLQDTEELRAELAQLSASVNEVAADLERSDPPAPVVAVADDDYSRREDEWAVVPVVVATPEPEKPPAYEPFKGFAEYTTGKYRLRKSRLTPKEEKELEKSMLWMVAILLGAFLFIVLIIFLAPIIDMLST
jgi:hypothetical protein